MLTIFTIPKPFTGHNKIIQRNAVQSWKRIKPECEIILFGNDEGVAEIAHELNIKHIPEVEKNEFGTPLLSSAFDLAQKLAMHDTLMYVNADIIFMPDIMTAVRKIGKKDFLICGRRWDLDILGEIDFNNNTWIATLLNDINTMGVLHGLSGMDYFIFPKNLINMPAFAVGRPGWDTWLIYNMRVKNIPVIDATQAITIIHQNHDYSHSKFGEKKRIGGPERLRNIEIAGGVTCMLTLRDADWELGENGLRRPEFPKRFFSLLSLFYPWRLLLLIKRNLQEHI